MKKLLNRRILGLVTLVLGTQLLTACIVLPVPGYRRAGLVIDAEPDYRNAPAPREHYYRDHDWRR